jgi:hypothetical protein
MDAILRLASRGWLSIEGGKVPIDLADMKLSPWAVTFYPAEQPFHVDHAIYVNGENLPELLAQVERILTPEAMD